MATSNKLQYLREVVFNSSALDAASRLRVSNPYTLLDVKQTRNANPLFVNDAAESGTGTAYGSMTIAEVC